MEDCANWRGVLVFVCDNFRNIHFHPVDVLVDKSKYIYRDLSDIRLLQKCLLGKPQNPSGFFNRCILDHVPKTAFVEPQTFETSVADTEIYFTEGNTARRNVSNVLGMTPGEYMAKALTNRLQVMRPNRRF
jgi:hypothetical protein